MTSFLRSAVLVVLTVAAPVASFAAPGPGPGSGGARQPMARRFDPGTMTSVSGEVMAVGSRQGRRGSDGVHVTLKSADGPVDVHLGPASFLAKHHLELAKGDHLQVTGSKVKVGEKPAIIAQKVEKGDTVVTLRDESGRPAWAGSRRGAGRGPAASGGSRPGAERGPAPGPTTP